MPLSFPIIDPVAIAIGPIAIRWYALAYVAGLLGAILAIVLFARSRRLNPLAMLDMAAVVTPIGLFFGRIANFINGELWGRPAPDFPYAVVFPHAGPEPRHPSQLYEAFGEGLILFIVMAFAARRFGFRRPGLLGGLFVLGYALARIVCEFFREPDAQLGFLFGSSVDALHGGITMGMLLSIPMAIVGTVAIWLALRGVTRPPEIKSAET